MMCSGYLDQKAKEKKKKIEQKCWMQCTNLLMFQDRYSYNYVFIYWGPALSECFQPHPLSLCFLVCFVRFSLKPNSERIKAINFNSELKKSALKENLYYILCWYVIFSYKERLNLKPLRIIQLFPPGETLKIRYISLQQLESL